MKTSMSTTGGAYAGARKQKKKKKIEAEKKTQNADACLNKSVDK